jgi:serralysin
MTNFAKNGGGILTDFGSTKDRAYSVLLQSDGKILVVGYSDNSSSTSYVANSIRALSIARYNTDGSLDTSFNGDGKFTAATSSVGYDALTLPSEKYWSANIPMALLI